MPIGFYGGLGKNRTPDKLPVSESDELYRLCDQHLFSVVQALQVEWVIGVGVFAEERAKNALKEITSLKFGQFCIRVLQVLLQTKAGEKKHLPN